jgi:hypothetical protein
MAMRYSLTESSLNVSSKQLSCIGHTMSPDAHNTLWHYEPGDVIIYASVMMRSQQCIKLVSSGALVGRPSV